MKIVTTSLLLLLFQYSTISIAQQQPSIQQIQIDVAYLASDLLEGRSTGTKGAVLASEYLVKRFKEIGLEPKGKDGTWYHPFSFKPTNNPHEKESSSKEINGRNVVALINKKAKPNSSYWCALRPFRLGRTWIKTYQRLCYS